MEFNKYKRGDRPVEERIYDIARNSQDSKWYVIGYCGRNRRGHQEWMSVSNAFANKNEAIARMKQQYQCDKAARAEIASIV